MEYIGTKKEGIDYSERRAAYALIQNDEGKVAIVYQTGELYGEMYNMIGGAVEEGESTEEALIRETEEEIGYKLENVKYLENLGCYYYVDFLDKYQLALIDFYTADFGEKISEQTEEGVELIWMDIEEAARKMYFEYHRYFLKKIMDNK